jgi:osmoprotectant transport system permease protein
MFAFAVFLLLGASPFAGAAERVIQVGSKEGTESIILGELATQLLKSSGIKAAHQKSLGGTSIVWGAMARGEIDLYADYTGTITREILKGENIRDEEQLRQALEKRGIGMTRPLGFKNNYEIGMREEQAQRLGIQSISDLVAHPELRFGFSSEFTGRSDGWPGLRDRYHLPQKEVRSLEHALAYKGLENGAIDATDAYTTDPQVRSLNLRLLRDDKNYFPKYYAVYLYRKKLETDAKPALDKVRELEGRVSATAITEMNARAEEKGGLRASDVDIVNDFLKGNSNPYFRTDKDSEGDVGTTQTTSWASVGTEILSATWGHLFLVIVSLTMAVVVAIPMGIVAARRPNLGQVILGTTGIIQTLPSLALLVFLIPFLGLGAAPAIVALFLYSLLPMVRNTYTGLHDLPVQIRESAEALGLTPFARLRLIELPMASRSILAGVKTSAVINVGTATLGGIIGAGGYGEIIMNGVRLADNWIIIQGAVPAALLAVVVQGLFELAERGLVPMGLRIKPAE